MLQSKLLYITTFGVGVLAIGLSLSAYKLYDFSLKNKELKDKISLEKSIHQNQISEILRRYDSVNETHTNVLFDAKTTLGSGKGYVRPKQNDKSAVKSEAVIAGKKISARNINARTVRMISRDFVETSVASKIDQVRVRFTLEEMKDSKAGKKKIWIQIVNPKNRLLALKGKSQTQLATEVYYDRHNTDVCVFVDLHQYHLIVGEYTINLIHEGGIIGSTNFRVN